MKFGVVVIGRNEGARLRQSLRSLSGTVDVVYVDSGSTDGSADWARNQGLEVLELDPSAAFTAARARNTGFRRLRDTVQALAYVQFVDGDCEMTDTWLAQAASFLDVHSDVAAVSGRLRERFPDRSIYNWLCEREWESPAGEVRACGGIAMMRLAAFESVAGFREDLIAGEEPELCVRLRAAGWRIWRLDLDMAWHDAAMTHFSQWWRRALRSGYAFAQGAYLHGALPERHWVWESRRAWLWGFFIPLVCFASTLVAWPWGLATWLVYPLQFVRQVTRNPGQLRDRAVLALFQLLARFPECFGQMKFWRDRLFGFNAGLVEYK